MWEYINNSLHLARKYARIFVRGHYLFREANSFPRAKLEENCELCGYKWRILFTNSLPSKTLTAYEVDFLVFSGTALSTSRFISSSVTKANRSAILTLILM